VLKNAALRRKKEEIGDAKEAGEEGKGDEAATINVLSEYTVPGYFKHYQMDISDRKSMELLFQGEGGAFDVICHLAARAGVRPSLENPEGYVQTNIQGTVILLDLAGKYQVPRFIYASSSSVYGANTKVPFSEDDPVENPMSPYATTKRACELMAATYHSLYGISVTGLRFFTVYGPRGRPDMAPFKFMDRISRGLPISRFGDGTSSRDYTFIDDITSGVLAAIDRPMKCEVINLGGCHVTTLNELIHVIETAVGKSAVITELEEQAGDVKTTYADCEKAKKLLGYQPTTEITEGINKTVEWYRQVQIN